MSRRVAAGRPLCWWWCWTNGPLTWQLHSNYLRKNAQLLLLDYCWSGVDNERTGDLKLESWSEVLDTRVVTEQQRAMAEGQEINDRMIHGSVALQSCRHHGLPRRKVSHSGCGLLRNYTLLVFFLYFLFRGDTTFIVPLSRYGPCTLSMTFVGKDTLSPVVNSNLKSLAKNYDLI